MVNIIMRGAINEDSNMAQKAHGRTESLVISSIAIKSDMFIIKFKGDDLKGVVTPHNDALVIHSTITNYNIA